jgi:ribosome maturation factor RimP
MSEEEDGKVLHIEVDKKGGVSLNEIEQFTDLINPEIDAIEGLNFSYSLDCSSPGAERFIEQDELPEHLNEYMEVSLADKKILGTLIEDNPEQITLKSFIKGRPKKDVVLKSDIKKIQLRIKI